jgi:3-hydroxybutyryl-CoA dehydrogenase
MMVVAILADEEIKAEIIGKGYSDAVEILWADSVQSLRVIEADVYFDLLFDNDGERISRLKFLLPKPLFVNAVIPTGKDLPSGFMRINAWPTMMQRKLVELAAVESDNISSVKNIFDGIGWAFQVVPDIPGMITPRIVSMIVNEAWFSLADNISTREEIDTAMKLGTNYPFGPFEWGDRVGLHRIQGLLKELQKTGVRYSIAPGLEETFAWR